MADFSAAARVQRLALKNPPMTIEQFLAKLEEAGLPPTAARFLEVRRPIGPPLFSIV